jgi:hypothetical protein
MYKRRKTSQEISCLLQYHPKQPMSLIEIDVTGNISQLKLLLGQDNVQENNKNVRIIKLQ